MSTSTSNQKRQSARSPLITVRRVVTVLAGLLVLKVTAAVVLGFVNYFPPNFQSDFLHGRESYFWKGYHWAFYVHIVSGPISLILGTILISEQFRLRFPRWHRYLGRMQAVGVLLLVTPSGLWMARYSASGPASGIGFVILSGLTATCMALGWRAAVQRRFQVHRRWMSRTYLLLCSAVVLRLLGGLATVLAVRSPWFDPVAAWTSWTLPLAVFELTRPAWIAAWRSRTRLAALTSASSADAPRRDWK